MSQADLKLEETDHESGSALSSASGDPHPWASYDQWNCFLAENVRTETVEIETNGTGKPWLEWRAEAAGQEFEFSPGEDLPLNAKRLLEHWKALARDSRRICFYAALLPDLLSQNGRGYWIIDRIKTENETWIAPNDPVPPDTELTEDEDLP